MNRTSVKVGITGLSLGIFSGLIWAQRAWRDTPAWDAKLTWSLLTLAMYLLYIFLQQRRGWVGERSAWIAVGGFLLVVFSYSIVNLFLSRSHTFF